MSKFRIPPRIDYKEAKAGVFFDVYDNITEYYYGAFKVRHFDLADPYIKIADDRYRREGRKELHGKDHSDDYLKAHYFVKTTLLDWKGVRDAQGNEVKYSEAEALDYLSSKEARYLLRNLTNISENPANFRGALLDTTPAEKKALNDKADLADHKDEVTKN